MDQATSPVGTSRWGTPDPRDANAYPKPTSSTPRSQWAWEFLRRRTDYRCLWEKQVKPFLNDCSNFDEARHFSTSAIRKRREHRLLGFGVVVVNHNTESCPAPLVAHQDRFPVFSGNSNFCNFTLDPRLARPPLFDGMFIKEVRVCANLVKPPKYLFEFDTRLPLELQLENAYRALLRARARDGISVRDVKLQIDKFPRYLRLLDFQDAAAPDKEIGDHLFPNRSGEDLRNDIRKNFAAASRWQDDYLIIALHHPDAS